ncbi:hypothetical protein C8J57DRAFT_1567168 [Mycena rebaudengoi]|nr:hypothetical protein C8J57DRAFT_1567168 [Mycena rebaudengoi]
MTFLDKNFTGKTVSVYNKNQAVELPLNGRDGRFSTGRKTTNPYRDRQFKIFEKSSTGRARHPVDGCRRAVATATGGSPTHIRSVPRTSMPLRCEITSIRRGDVGRVHGVLYDDERARCGTGSGGIGQRAYTPADGAPAPAPPNSGRAPNLSSLSFFAQDSLDGTVTHKGKGDWSWSSRILIRRRRMVIDKRSREHARPRHPDHGSAGGAAGCAGWGGTDWWACTCGWFGWDDAGECDAECGRQARLRPGRGRRRHGQAQNVRNAVQRADADGDAQDERAQRAGRRWTAGTRTAAERTRTRTPVTGMSMKRTSTRRSTRCWTIRIRLRVGRYLTTPGSASDGTSTMQELLWVHRRRCHPSDLA